MEGLLNSIKNLFTKKEVLDAKNIYTSTPQQAKEVREVLARTLADPKWVEKNTRRKRKIKLGRKYSRALGYTGKTLTPLEAIKTAHAELQKADRINNPGGALAKYFERLDRDIAHLERFYKPGKTTTEEVLVEMRRLIRANPAPKVKKDLFDADPSRYYDGKLVEMESLGVAEVVALGSTLAQVWDEVRVYVEKNPWLLTHGTGWEHAIWSDESDIYDSEEVRTSTEYRHFYYQDKPSEIADSVFDSLYDLGACIEAALYIASNSVGVKMTNFSNESIRSSDPHLTEPSMEGLLNSIKGLFTKKEVLDGESVRAYSGERAKKLIDYLSRTFADPAWVKKNAVKNPKPVKLSADNYRYLVYTGKELPPLEAIEHALADFKQADSTSNRGGALDRFFKKHAQDAKHLERFYKPGKTTTEEMLAEMRRLIKANPAPKVGPNRSQRYKDTMGPELHNRLKDKTFEIAPVDATSLVLLGKRVVDILTHVSQYCEKRDWLYFSGIAWGHDAWSDETDIYDSDEIVDSEEFDYFYHQSPLLKHLADSVDDFIYQLVSVIQVVLYIASNSVGVKMTNFSNESVFSLGIGDDEKREPVLSDEDFLTVDESGEVLLEGEAELVNTAEKITALESLRERIEKHGGVSMGIALEAYQLDRSMKIPHYTQYPVGISNEYLEVSLEALEASMESLKEKLKTFWYKLKGSLSKLFRGYVQSAAKLESRLDKSVQALKALKQDTVELEIGSDEDATNLAINGKVLQDQALAQALQELDTYLYMASTRAAQRLDYFADILNDPKKFNLTAMVYLFTAPNEGVYKNKFTTSKDDEGYTVMRTDPFVGGLELIHGTGIDKDNVVDFDKVFLEKSIEQRKPVKAIEKITLSVKGVEAIVSNVKRMAQSDEYFKGGESWVRGSSAMLRGITMYRRANTSTERLVGLAITQVSSRSKMFFYHEIMHITKHYFGVLRSLDRVLKRAVKAHKA